MDIWAIESIEQWAATVLERCGLGPEPARQAAAMLVKTDLRGVRTHGIMRLPAYVQNLQSGTANPRPAYRFDETAGATIFDADRGLGQVAGPAAVSYAVEKARRQAFVPMVLKDVGHLGALGLMLLEAVEQGMMALLMQNGPPLMATVGATARAIGNNPLAFAAPVEGGAPLIFDMATSETAFGRILESARAGQPIPESWALDAAGNRTTDATAALSGILLPSAGHKGVGLAMIVECLAGALSGTDPSKSGDGRSLPGSFGAFLLVTNPALLIGEQAFRANMKVWLERYKAAGDLPYPGERSAAREVAGRRSGLDVAPALASDLGKVGDALGVPFPAPIG